VQSRRPHYRSAPAPPVPARRGAARAPRGALPRTLRRPRLLLLGCGDVGLRFCRRYGARFVLYGVVRRPDAVAAVRAAGARPVVADLDAPGTLRRLRGLAPAVLHAAPPPNVGRDDPRTRRALAVLHAARRWVYLSTTGVYGDCGGALVEETRPVAPATDRAVRRVAAERRLRARAAGGAIRATVLRVPGIYAEERLPLERLARGTPAAIEAEDVHTNHVHADDLARIAFVALCRGRSQRTVHAVDGSAMKMGEYLDAVADACGLPRPPRLARAELAGAVSPVMLSFMSESRRLVARRLERELRVRLEHPTVRAFLARRAPAAHAGPC
jgi:nucleoside-diphosphate-sugar epimerase